MNGVSTPRSGVRITSKVLSMSEVNAKSKEVVLNRPNMAIYGMFADLSVFTQNLPEQYKGSVEATPDTVVFTANGLRLGVQVVRREPFYLIELQDDGQSFLPFQVIFHLDPLSTDKTLFSIEINAEMNMMLKMMIGSKLQDALDQSVDQLEKVVNSAGEAGVPNFDFTKTGNFS